MHQENNNNNNISTMVLNINTNDISPNSIYDDNNKNNGSFGNKRAKSNNNIFERDVQMEYNPTSPVSLTNSKINSEDKNLEIDPKSPSSNPFFVSMSARSVSSPLTTSHAKSNSVSGTNMFNGFSFGTSLERKRSLCHSADQSSTSILENNLMKVPTHVLSVDDYINSDMDEKCCTEKPHICSEACDCVVKRSPKIAYDEYYDTEKNNDFDERMEYFNHKRTSFDNYLTDLNSKKKKKKEHGEKSSKLARLLKTHSNSSDEVFDDDESKESIADLTSDVMRAYISPENSNYLSEEECEHRRLNRERSRSLSSIIVKGLSDSFK